MFEEGLQIFTFHWLPQQQKNAVLVPPPLSFFFPLVVVLFFRDRVSMCNSSGWPGTDRPGWPQIHSHLSASPSRVLGFKVCATMPGWKCFVLAHTLFSVEAEELLIARRQHVAFCPQEQSGDSAFGEACTLVPPHHPSLAGRNAETLLGFGTLPQFLLYPRRANTFLINMSCQEAGKSDWVSTVRKIITAIDAF